ncbi:hypothetical protein AKUH3B111A_02350 [Apilactobacillus kunkeei]|nr:hypothetical protein AKUH3B103M_02330 [Apilactobacillus kunkeei]CAI2564345.1 hypothetical protein AKUH3B104X_02350 [Apilactobacillus kunkeei]CAI2564349.1 hypothetical protein AKUH3B111A_02350 [Apilactobacillus kunkeei]
MMEKLKQFLKWLTPFIIFLVLALLVVAIPLIKKQTFLGSDSLFHFNRFYDAAMQLKTHNISYFQTNYGFLGTGRMLSTLYGPVAAYVGGLLLLLACTWFKFEILTDLIVLIVSALGMYKLCRVNNVDKYPAIFMGFIYMYSSLVMQWVTAQQFTGVGAMIVPFVMIYATQMVRKNDVSFVGFAFVMSLLVQTHLMSAMITAIGIVPFFVVGMIKAVDKKQRVRMLLHTIYAALITMVLTINVWYNLIYISATNHLLPVYPVPHVRTYGYNFNVQSLVNIMKPTEFILFIFVLYFVIRRFKQVDILTKTTGFTGFFFLVISWSHFPWGVLQYLIPQLSYTLQFPKRFLVIAFVCLLITFGRISTYEIRNNTHKSNYAVIVTILLLIVGSAGLDFYAIHQRSVNYVALNTKRHKNNKNDNSIYYYMRKHHRTIQKDTQSHKLSNLLEDIIKATPDYVPSYKQIKGHDEYDKLNPYELYYKEYIEKNHNKKIHFKHVVRKDGSLTIKFKLKKAQEIQVPLVKYAQTKVTVNGTVKNVKTTKLGAVIVSAKKGNNRVNIKYVTSFTTRLMMVLTWISWILFGIFAIIKIRRNK